nr:MAG TPA: hypothetical protein [Caudoviricetes sp.]
MLVKQFKFKTLALVVVAFSVTPTRAFLCYTDILHKRVV